MRELRRHFGWRVCGRSHPRTGGVETTAAERLIRAEPFETAQLCARGEHDLVRYAYTYGLHRVCGVIVILSLAVVGLPARVLAQEPPVASEPAAVSFGPLPSAQERALAPIPPQFDWMQRDVRPNPLLESLLGVRERPTRLFMSVNLTEQYSDNFFQTDGGGMTEYRTSGTLATVYRTESGRAFLALANTVSGNYDARAEDSTIGFANFTLNTGYELPRLSLALSDSFIRDDESSQADENGVRRGRRTFLQNRLSPQVRYAFSRLTSMTAGYTNTVVRSDGGVSGDDAITHGFSGGLQHRFSPVVTGNIRYTYTDNDTDGAVDSRTHGATADLGYAIARRTSIIVNASGSTADRTGGGQDSNIYGASLGVRQQLSTFLGAFVSLGAMVLDEAGEDPEVRFTWQANLDGALPFSRFTTLTLTTQQRVNDTVGGVDQVGIVLSQSVRMTLNHTFSRFLQGVLFLNYTRTEQLEDSVGTSESAARPGRTDNFWRAGARATYALTRFVALSVSYVYQRRESNLAGADFDENQVFVTLSSGFSLL